MLVSPGKDLNKKPAGYLSLSANYDSTKSNSSATRRETVAKMQYLLSKRQDFCNFGSALKL